MVRAPAVAALLCLACSNSPRHALDSAPLALDQPLALPLAPDVLLPLVGLRLNGIEFTFLVDCGSALSFVEPRRATELGLPLRPYSGSTRTSGTGGDSVIDHYVAVDEFDLGGLRLTRLALPALDDEILRSGDFSGILGQDLLARLVVVVDRKRHALHLLPPSTDRAGIKAYLEGNELGKGAWAVVDTVPQPSPSLKLDLRGRLADEVWIHLDTGSTYTSLPERVVVALKLPPTDTGSAELRGVGGTRTAQAYLLKDFGFFGFRVTNEIYSNSRDYGLLGMDVLGEFVFVLDGPGRALWLHHREVEPDTTALPTAER
jgi:hypothetical protein